MSPCLDLFSVDTSIPRLLSFFSLCFWSCLVYISISLSVHWVFGYFIYNPPHFVIQLRSCYLYEDCLILLLSHLCHSPPPLQLLGGLHYVADRYHLSTSCTYGINDCKHTCISSLTPPNPIPFPHLQLISSCTLLTTVHIYPTPLPFPISYLAPKAFLTAYPILGLLNWALNQILHRKWLKSKREERKKNYMKIDEKQLALLNRVLCTGTSPGLFYSV